MRLFLTKDMSSAHMGQTSVKEIYLGDIKIWPLGLPNGTATSENISHPSISESIENR